MTYSKEVWIDTWLILSYAQPAPLSAQTRPYLCEFMQADVQVLFWFHVSRSLLAPWTITTQCERFHFQLDKEVFGNGSAQLWCQNVTKPGWRLKKPHHHQQQQHFYTVSDQKETLCDQVGGNPSARKPLGKFRPCAPQITSKIRADIADIHANHTWRMQFSTQHKDAILNSHLMKRESSEPEPLTRQQITRKLGFTSCLLLRVTSNLRRASLRCKKPLCRKKKKAAFAPR